MLAVRFGPIAEPAPAADRASSPPTAPGIPPPAPRSGPPILAYTLLGVGAVALGFSTYFEVTQLNDFYALKNGCTQTGTCRQSDVDAVSNKRIYAGVALGVGLVAVGTGTVLLLTRSSPAKPTAAWLGHVDAAPVPGGGMAVLRGSF
jgi:hypothetical protein